MKWNKQSGSLLILNENGIKGIVIDDSCLYYYKTTEMNISRIHTI